MALRKNETQALTMATRVGCFSGSFICYFVIVILWSVNFVPDPGKNDIAEAEDTEDEYNPEKCHFDFALRRVSTAEKILVLFLASFFNANSMTRIFAASPTDIPAFSRSRIFWQPPHFDILVPA